MGRWTPLILMAGGLAILLGTLLGINFPMGGQQGTKVTSVRRDARVLPANIDVNSSDTRRQPTFDTRRRVAQSNASNEPEPTNTENTQDNNTTNDNTTDSQSTDTSTTSNSQSQDNSSKDNDQNNNQPIRALW